MIKIYPSHAARIVKCPGSAVLNSAEVKIDQDRTAADEGIELHRRAQEYLQRDIRCAPDDPIASYLAYCRSLPRGQVMIEKKLNTYWGNGYVDFAVVYDDVLEIVDFKTGRRVVDDYDQLVIYAAALITQCINTVRLTYVQPNGYHPDGPIRMLVMTRDELKQRSDYINSRKDLALTDRAPLFSGSHCYRCARQYDCPANTMAAGNAIDVASDVSKQGVDSSSEWLSNELIVLERAAELLKERIISVEEILTHKIKSGERSSVFEIAPSFGHRKFNISNDELKVRCELAGIEHSETVLKSPTQLEKCGLDVTKITSKPSAMKLKRINNEVFKNG